MSSWLPIVLGGGALGLALFALRPSCQVGIFLYLPSQLSQGEMEAFARAGGTHLVVKINDGAGAFEAEETQDLIRRARALGLIVEGWGYLYSRSTSEAEAEADAAYALAAAYGLGRYYTDAEAEWYKSADPEGAGLAFVARWRANGRIELACSDADFRTPPALTPRLLGAFDVYAPQCYGTSDPDAPGQSAALQNVWLARIAKGTSIGVRTEPIFASGRIDESSGEQWSPWTGPRGVLATAAALRLRRWSFWYGAGSPGRIDGSNPSPDGAIAALVPLAIRSKTA